MEEKIIEFPNNISNLKKQLAELELQEASMPNDVETKKWYKLMNKIKKIKNKISKIQARSKKW